ncbi:hypothetical protein [Lactococcus lactis]|uniref:hypothetical protein n=1 Tax=Lactococcus lactis TaxID=1358 RepID=UPI0028BE9D6B|nr:hypothetical protein [Lactococcus lactis]WNN67408.1 hypothetical protein RIN59_06740 [Lactococcus lactis]WPK09845.1 hypothetical protein R6U80_04625 [Lactococcus lactis]
MKLRLKDCIITSIEGGSVDVSPTCPTCWGGEEWVDYIEVDFEGDTSVTYNEVSMTKFLDWIFTLIETGELSEITREKFDKKMEELEE